MKNNYFKTLLMMLGLLIGGGSLWAADVIDNAATSSKLSGTATSTWVNAYDLTLNSGAVVNVRSMGTKTTSNALQWNANGYLYMKTSGGTLKSVTIKGASKTVNVYASNNAYSAAPSGTALGTISVTSEGATYNFTSDYTYLALKGTASSTSIVEISIEYKSNDAGGGSTPATPYTVSFNAGTNGICSTPSLTEASAGAGVTLPNVTANPGFDFVGWSTSSTPSSANAGAAGDTYKPSATTTLYAYYKMQLPKYTGLYEDIDLGTGVPTTATEDCMTWVNTYFNITDTRKSGGTAANNYYPGSSTVRSSTRFYKDATVVFTPATGVTITGIEYTATSNDYTTAFAASTWTNATAIADVDNKIAYVTPTDGTRAVSGVMSNTTGATKIRVYYEALTTGTLNFVATADNTHYYATFSSDRAIKFDEAFINDDESCAAAIKAYAVSVNGNELVLTDQYDVNNDGNHTYVPANTGILFKYTLEDGTFDGTVPFEYADDVADYLYAVNGNLLVPATTPMTAADTKFYKLAKSSEGKLGFFYGATDGAAFTMTNANGAYLAVPNSLGSVKGFSFDAIETAILAVEVENNSNVIYDLQGRRVSKAQKGLYIVNGKKVLF